MRLDVLETGHRRPARLFMSGVARTGRVEMPDIIKTLLYRPEFFGRPMLALTRSAMRGPSFWTPAEREYFALFTARMYECPFCIESHAELVRLTSRGAVDPEDPGSLREEAASVLGLLEAVSAAQPASTADDVAAARGKGVPDDAVIDALHVSLVWNTINRLANAFGFALRAGQLRSGTRALNRSGYRMPGWLLGGPKPESVRRIRHTEAGHYEDAVADLLDAVFASRGASEHRIRAAAESGDPLPEPWGDYAEKLRTQSYRLGDSDIAALKDAGCSEDEVFEVTVAVSVAAALRSRDAGLDCLREAGPEWR